MNVLFFTQVDLVTPARPKTFGRCAARHFLDETWVLLQDATGNEDKSVRNTNATSIWA